MTIAEEAEKLAKKFEYHAAAIDSTGEITVDAGIAQLARLVERLANEASEERHELTLDRIAARAEAYHAATMLATVINSGGDAAELKKVFAEVSSTFADLLGEIER